MNYTHAQISIFTNLKKNQDHQKGVNKYFVKKTIIFNMSVVHTNVTLFLDQ